MTDPLDAWLDRQRIEPLAPPPGAFERAAQSAVRRRRRRAATAAGLGLLVVTAVAMGSVSWGRDAAPPIGPVPTDTGTGTTTASAPASSPIPSAASSRPAPSGSGTGLADVARCTVADLRVTVEADPRPYGADHYGLKLVLTNVGPQRCLLTGYPRVAFAQGPDGPAIGADFTRTPSARQLELRMAPGAAGEVSMRLARVDTDDAAACRPTPVAGFRVHPPEQSASVFVPYPTEACSIPGVDPPTIMPVTPSA
jgi:hypothetical protein